jgi:hypothetical protein
MSLELVGVHQLLRFVTRQKYIHTICCTGQIVHVTLNWHWHKITTMTLTFLCVKGMHIFHSYKPKIHLLIFYQGCSGTSLQSWKLQKLCGLVKFTKNTNTSEASVTLVLLSEGSFVLIEYLCSIQYLSKKQMWKKKLFIEPDVFLTNCWTVLGTFSAYGLLHLPIKVHARGSQWMWPADFSQAPSPTIGISRGSNFSDSLVVFIKGFMNIDHCLLSLRFWSTLKNNYISFKDAVNQRNFRWIKHEFIT